MNQHAPIRIGHSACPHDCPSTCALDVEVVDGKIGRVHGAKENSYTAGVICAKVARYAERIHHPERLLKPLVRAGAKGDGKWKEASWEAALDLIAERAMKRDTGARALRAVMDELMVDLLYDLPDAANEGVTYVIDEDAVTNGPSLERMARRSKESA